MRASPRLKPLHPPFTDFPVALWVVSFVFDFCSLGVGNAMVKAAFYNIAAGCITAILAAATGVFDFTRIGDGAPYARRTALIHGALNVFGLMIFSVNLFARTGVLSAGHTPAPLIVLSGVGLAVVVTAAWLGGTLVYDLGVNVREVADTERAEAAFVRPEVPPRPERPSYPPRERPPSVPPGEHLH
jgi:uncharacterized membrane protein